MTSLPFISAHELAGLLDARARSIITGSPVGSRPAPVVLDASYLLEKPEFDGDYRSGTAFAQWREHHIPGSRYVDVQEQFSVRGATHFTHPSAEAIAAELARLGIARDRPVVVYDTTNTMFAARLWYLLTWVGVDARVLDGGLDAWTAAGHPIASGAATAPVSVEAWQVDTPRNAWVTKEELAARAADDETPLVCGLPAGSFTGADTSRYSRRGRIPGSVNVSARDLFAPEGTVLPPAEVREAYGDIAAADEVLLYCGGGISAAANALTLATIGVGAVRIYDGSLEEWSADESLPLEVGA